MGRLPRCAHIARTDGPSIRGFLSSSFTQTLRPGGLLAFAFRSSCLHIARTRRTR